MSRVDNYSKPFNTEIQTNLKELIKATPSDIKLKKYEELLQQLAKEIGNYLSKTVNEIPKPMRAKCIKRSTL